MSPNPAILTWSHKASATGWTPLDLPSIAAWFDAAKTSTITASSGSVSAWASRVGSLVATQGTGGKQPTTGATSLNGKNVVSFDGSDGLATTASLNLSSTDAFFIFGVFTATAGGDQVILETSVNYNVNVGTFIFYREGTGGLQLANRSTVINGRKSAGALNATPKVVTGQVDRSQPTASDQTHLYIDGTEYGTLITVDLLSGNLGSQTLYIGSRNSSSLYLTGYIAEIGIHSAALDTTSRQKVEGYLAHKWGLTSGLDVSHPYKTTAP